MQQIFASEHDEELLNHVLIGNASTFTFIASFQCNGSEEEEEREERIYPENVLPLSHASDACIKTGRITVFVWSILFNKLGTTTELCIF